MYVIIIGGQAYPMPLFPGKTILESGFYDGVEGAVAAYTPSLPEILLGIGGVAVALLITAVGIRMLQFLPESLADGDTEPRGVGGLGVWTAKAHSTPCGCPNRRMR